MNHAHVCSFTKMFEVIEEGPWGHVIHITNHIFALVLICENHKRSSLYSFVLIWCWFKENVFFEPNSDLFLSQNM
jgi:hypothetical protein